MQRSMFAVVVAALLATPALALDKDKTAASAPTAGMDMSKMGPWSRKPTNEKQTKKDVEAFFKEEEALCKKADGEAMIGHVDFPVYMVTDDSKGMPQVDLMSREKYTAMMKPFMENRPKDFAMTHKPTITVLSDSLVSITDEFTQTANGRKLSGRNAGMLVKRDGQWKWKMMAEAGWGDMASQGTGGSSASMENKK